MNKQHQFFIVSLLLGCTTDGGGERSDADDGITAGLTAASAGTGNNTDVDPTGGGTGHVDGTSAPASSDGDGGPKYDVGIESYCQIHGGGIHCDGNKAVECTDQGDTVSSENCDPDLCLAGTGCVVCLDGQFTCMGDKVMSCNAAAVPAAWQLVEVCDPASGEGCDLGLGACAVLQPVGTNVPTGEYYQFADFQQGSTPFLSGYDVDSFEDNIYVLGYNNGIDHYTVELLDSDLDGELEPNQHPDNPDNTGAIEARVLTFVETLPPFGTPYQSVSEIYASGDRIYLAGTQITEYVFAGGATSIISTPPGWAGNFSHIGFDDVRGVWYASNESVRRVFQYDSAGAAWGIAFLYPELAGDHMDGMEVVTDPNTNIPYVYVSDMTSDFIGQYRLDPELGWVQQNLFSYSGTSGSLVEGMGFGALNHFWATGGNTLYEIGGGDLADFTEPPG